MKSKYIIAFIALTAPSLAQAEWSGNATIVSDYLFNGISQTQRDAALQLGVDWSSDGGLYTGLWGSNVDFGDDTDVEVDVYAGYAFTVKDSLDMDVGVAWYTYHGGDFSDDGNYPEVYLKTSFKEWQVNVWYSNDYFGTGAGHLITMVNYVYPIGDNQSLTFGVDHNQSLDDHLFEWDVNDGDYLHWQVVFDWQLEKYAVSMGLHDTDLKGDNSSMFLVGLTTTF